MNYYKQIVVSDYYNNERMYSWYITEPSDGLKRWLFWRVINWCAMPRL